MLHRRFGVIKLWPELKAAEDECIARLKVTAKSLGLECLEVDSFARLTVPPYTQLTRDDIDFVLSLHFETPKRYDIFSFVTLWNPLQFFHEWGYRKFTRHLLTHDDFLSCDSPWADDHIRRCVVSDPMREGPNLHLYHSLSEPLLEPTTGDQKLFYAGINWERVSKKPGRHQALLDLLDKDGDLRIYGPKIYLGVEVWAGYKSYSGPVPFDGKSMVRLIHKAGISLVLSSPAHIQSELMSSRLFESLAAGAVIICDENPFARRHFGDALLYIDSTTPAEKLYEQVQSHLDWIRSEPAKARELAMRAQEIFRTRFTLDRCLEKIYQELPARKKKLECLYKPRRHERVAMFLLLPEFDPEVLEQHLATCLAQKQVEIRPVLVMDRHELELFGPRVQSRLDELALSVELLGSNFFTYSNGSTRNRRNLGQAIHDAIRHAADSVYLCIVGPNERLFSDHICSLLRKLQDCDDAAAAWCDMLWFHKNDSTFADLSDDPDFQNWESNRPVGFGRFLFRTSALRPELKSVLPYLDVLSIYAMAGTAKTVPTRRCTAMVDIQNPFSQRCTPPEAEREREILIDYAPDAFRRDLNGRGDSRHLQPMSLSLERMEENARARLATQLAHSVPWPAFLEKIVFGTYRWWLRRRK